MKLIKEISLNSMFVNVLIFLLAILLGAIVYYKSINYLFVLAILMWVLIVETPVHELLHKLGGKICGVECEINLKYKWRNWLWRIDNISRVEKHPYCRPIREITFKESTIIAIAPLIIPVIWLIVYLVSQNMFTFIF